MDSKQPPTLPSQTSALACAPQRRSFLGLAAMGLSAIAGVLVAIPFVGYVVGNRKRRVAWVELGAISDFGLNQTRLVTFDNPLRQPWDGITVADRRLRALSGNNEEKGEQFLVLSVNCAHLGCPVSWFPQSELVHVPLPRRRLLRRRRARLRPAAARLVPLRVASAKWQTGGASSALSHAPGHAATNG